MDKLHHLMAPEWRDGGEGEERGRGGEKRGRGGRGGGETKGRRGRGQQGIGGKGEIED